MTLHITATSHWTADRGPLRVGRSGEPARTRFARMVAHVLDGVGARSGDDASWIVGTRHGPWGSMLLAPEADGTPSLDTAATIDAIAAELGHEGTTAIVCAGACTLAMALLEASARTRSGAAVIVIAEESTPAGSGAPIHDGFAVALRVEAGRADVPSLGVPVRRAELARPVVPAALTACPLWAGLTLVDAIERGAWGWHALEAPLRARDPVWAVELTAPV